MTSRRKRRVEQILYTESHGLRRSPRLSQRYTGMGETTTTFPLNSAAYAATSRQSLSGYNYKDFEESSTTTGSILDESGQSVPPSFDIDEEEAVQPSMVPATGDSGVSLSHGSYISAATAQQYEVDGENDMPQHLYGLDGSDDESAPSAMSGESPKRYHIFTKERVITPTRTPQTPDSQVARSLPVRVFAFFVSLVYKLGSLLYLATTAILCLDVVILHWLFNVFHSMAGGMEGRPTKSWHRFWILPLTLCGLIVFLLGGGLIPESTLVTPPPKGTIPLNYSEQIDLAQLKAEIMQSVTATLQKDLSTFKSSFWTEVDNHVENYITQVIASSEVKLESSMKGQVDSEVEERKAALQQLKESIWKEVNSSLETELSSLDSQLASLERSLLDRAETSGITDTMLTQMVEHQVAEQGKQQLEAAKDQWIANVKRTLGVEIKQSSGAVREELLQALREREQSYSNQLADLEKAQMRGHSSLEKQLQGLEGQLQTTISGVSEVKQSVERHGMQLASLQQNQTELLITLSEFKQSYLARLKSVEEAAGGSISSSQASAIFNEDLNRALGDSSSPLRRWLKETLASSDTMKNLEIRITILEKTATSEGVPGTGLTKKDVEQLIQAALHLYSADRIGKFDFALENSGGSVIANKCSKTFSPTLATVSLLGIPLWHVTSSAKTIIQPQVYPGDCWAFEGSAGHALIRLKDEVVVTGVTLEHISKELTPNGSLSSAPKDFRVLGKDFLDDLEEGVLLGTFTYDADGPPIQSFDIPEAKDPKSYGYVLFQFLTNHGNEHYTCVYRVRVHGHYLE